MAIAFDTPELFLRGDDAKSGPSANHGMSGRSSLESGRMNGFQSAGGLTRISIDAIRRLSNWLRSSRS